MATLEHVRLAEAIRMKLVEHTSQAAPAVAELDPDAFERGADECDSRAADAVEDMANTALETMAVYLTLSGQLEAAKLLRSWRS